jgi:TatD DNase family protein
VIDVHCHLDAYPDPYETALAADRARVFTIAVTELPSGFEAAYPHVRPLRAIRLAVGLHPLRADQHAPERDRFAACLARTSYVGEVGLDFSPEGWKTRRLQEDSFRFVLELLRVQRKFVSIHSRRAETAVLDALEEHGVRPAVFHWFSGSLAHVDRLIEQGHACSINPAMVRSTRGRAIIARLPQERVLTETDGPYVTVRGRSALPTDVAEVETYLARLWGYTLVDVRQQLVRNLKAMIPAMAGG